MTTEPTTNPQDVVEEVYGVTAKDRYGLVLTLLFAGYILSGIEMETWVWALYGLLWVVVLVASFWAPELPRRLRQVGLLATALVVIAVVLDIASTGERRGAGFLLLAVAQSAAFLAILVRISQHSHVTHQSVFGAVSAYALIGFVMAALYNGFELMFDAPFLQGVTSPGDYSYYSFVTLTTVGYGDITPVSDLAKRLVVAEAFVGQVFLVTLIARLVSLLGTSRLRS